jgi:hypothetical protein
MAEAIFDFSTFLSDEALEEIAAAVRASPKGKLVLNCLYILAGNGHYRGAQSIADAAKIINDELHSLKMLGEDEQIVTHLIYAPSLLSGVGARIVEWAARDLYESMSKALFLQYSWNEASRELASSSRLDGISVLTRKIIQSAHLVRHLDGVILAAHFIPGDIFARYKGYSNRLVTIPLDDAVYPTFVRKETQNYFVGSKRCREDVTRALSAYGVPSDEAERRTKITGQPISPRSIKGAPWNLSGKEPKPSESHWDGKRPPRYLIAMGGAGAQLPQMEALLSSYTKFSGKRPEVVFYVGHHLGSAARLESLGGPEGTKVIKFPNRLEAIEALHHEIRKCDAMITKPSELSFYPVPIYALPPIGFHEEMNLATAILERRARPMNSLWSLPRRVQHSA